MAFGKASSQTPEAAEQRAEGRLLNALKGALREAVAMFQAQENLTQNHAAEKLGCDAGFLSRTLNPDFHVNSRTLAQIMHRTGGEWVIGWYPTSRLSCEAQPLKVRLENTLGALGSATTDGFYRPSTKRPPEAVNSATLDSKEVNVSGSKSKKAIARLVVV